MINDLNDQFVAPSGIGKIKHQGWLATGIILGCVIGIILLEVFTR